MARLPVLKFRPILLRKPWGGDGLWHVLGKGAPADTDMGESWELSDRPEAETLVADGPFAGASLKALIQSHGAELLGPAAEGFPLLYKFICAREKLSVQVHPGAGSTLGQAKTECWYVVDAAPGAELILGVAGGRSREKTLALLKSPGCEEVLRRWPVRRGDVFFIPAGTVHAITEGLLLYEVQQNSDTTFRLYDWGRVDAQGLARALHVEQASRVADLEEREGYRIPGLRVDRETHAEDFLAACPYFALSKWSGFKAPARLESRGKFHVVSVVSGTLSIRGNGEPVRLERGDTALVPAGADQVWVEGDNGAEAIVSFVPDLEEEIRRPLRAAGHAREAVDRLYGPPGMRV
jgi:mannose-6-phosphate isomerase